MCSIMGYDGKDIAVEEFKKALDATISRGPDDTRIVETKSSILGFHRLAIMGLTQEGMQPFSLGGDYCVCNGEIYCFRPIKEKLKAKYAFRSDSDCEIILPLYREMGLE
ncbi:MAG: asparagine synthetase B, partial [Clostridia bacterium]|nr:asparagine synthetase B [Clostridia bacterium]